MLTIIRIGQIHEFYYLFNQLKQPFKSKDFAIKTRETLKRYIYVSKHLQFYVMSFVE